MEVFSSDRKLSELDTESDLSDLLANDYYSAGILQQGSDMTIGSYGIDNDNWLDSFFENDVVLNDKMMSEAMQPPHIKSEHSYSMTNSESDSDSPLNLSMEKMDTMMLTKDMDNEVFACTTGTTTMPTLTATTRHQQQQQQQQQQGQDHITTATTATSVTTSHSHIVQHEHSSNSEQSNNSTCSNIMIKQEPVDTDSQHMFIKQPTIVLATQQVVPHVSTSATTHKHDQQIILSKVNIKMETDSFDQMDQSALETVTLPPTPPSSSSSDSEGGQSPNRSAPSSPQRSLSAMRHQTLRTLSQPVFSSPIPQSGVLVLSEEEKRTLISEGYPIPNKLPLSKQEEKNLKKIRRKIKNKISAQESRRKKKEYLETLEKKMEIYTQENNDLRKKVDSLENNNRSLVTQLQKLQALVGRITKPASPSSTQTGTCLMVLALCFAVFLGGWSPSSLSIAYSPLSLPLSSPTNAAKVPLGGAQTTRDVHVDDYATPNMRSRVLLSLKEDPDDSHAENHRPIGPFSCSEMFNRFWNVIGGIPVEAGSYKDVSGNVKPTSGSAPLADMPNITPSSQEEIQKKVNASLVKAVQQATMHPDIAANVMYIEPVANTTA